MFVFPANDAGYRKRKKAFRACIQCKKARRRCLAAPNDRRCLPCLEAGTACSLVPEEQKEASATALDPERVQKAPEDESSKTRFYSALDPSAELLEDGNPDRDRVGKWMCKLFDADETGESSPDDSQRPKIKLPGPLDKFFLAHLQEIKAFDYLPEANRNALIDIYFKYSNSVLPIVDEACFRRQYESWTFSPPLLQAILMVASRHAKAIPYLPKGTCPRTFASICNRKVLGLLYAKIEPSAFSLCRIHALLALHCEGPDGFSEASYNLTSSFHYAHSMGVHLRRSAHDTTIPSYEAKLQMWWSIWGLDRMLTSMMGCPMNSHSRDVAITIESDQPSKGYAAEFIQGCLVFESVIDLYRPYGTLVIPERVRNDVIPPDDGTASRAIVRLVHYVAIILAYKRAMTDETRQEYTELLLKWCNEVCNIVESYEDMAPLPIIPYSVSLTLAVFLKSFPRHESLAGWRRACDILDKLSISWWAAESMARMGQRVFEKYEIQHHQKRDLPQIKDLQLEQAQPQEQLQQLPELLDTQMLSDLLFDVTSTGFGTQVGISNEVDRGVVDYWFSENGSFDL
ncbi:hypothetical protein TRVA0_005S03378 [Trichomonascus vanleenenianus]|uniref:Zn(II)2Cys6 transcription factor n=1 Tax=Trichomonascus vanleenenianus TaxID=2268995 RepID=UPI003EC9C7EA